MADISITTGPGLFQRVFGPVETFFHTVRVAQSLAISVDGRMNEVRRLQALSDVELSELGIARARIVQYVFRDIYAI
ncbi:MAG: hypothetical protein AAFR73_05190 [Pseudomonadota bacterium]